MLQENEIEAVDAALSSIDAFDEATWDVQDVYAHGYANANPHTTHPHLLREFERTREIAQAAREALMGLVEDAVTDMSKLTARELAIARMYLRAIGAEV